MTGPEPKDEAGTARRFERGSDAVVSYSSQWGGSGWGSERQDRSRSVERQRITSGLQNVAEVFKEGLAAHAATLGGRDRARLDMSITCFRRAITAAAGDDPHRGQYANSLGVALLDRYRLAEDIADLDEALDHLVIAYESAARNTLARARGLRNLSDALELRLPLTGTPLSDAQLERLPSLESLRREKSRTPGLTAIERLSAARESGHAAVAKEGPAAGCPDLSHAVALLPLVVWGGRDQVLEFLADYRGLASEAAASALSAGDATLAVRVLEQGRAVVWEQDLTNRTPQEELLKRLVEQGSSPRASSGRSTLKKSREERRRESRKNRRKQPVAAAVPKVPQLPSDLVTRMDRAFAGLTQLGPPTGASGPSLSASAKGDPRMDTDRWGFPWRAIPGVAELSAAVREWDSLSRTAQRGLPYISFLRPDYVRHIRPAASEGPVVYINVSPWRCDAVIVTRDAEHPDVVHLPDLTAADAEQRAQTYLAAMTTTDGEGREDTIREVLRWLWRTVASPVLDALTAPPELPGASDTHVWWIPTGPLTTLPLHAATAANGYSVLDRVTSSYTPTVSALMRARKTRDTLVLGQRALQRHLLVAPAAGHLPAAARTLAKLAVLLPWKQRTTLVGPEATWDEVRKALPQHAWTHIDCHAVQSLDEPLKSHLSLHDRPLTVADLAELPSGEAEFALLAACTTAAGGSLVRDEWVSLAAALMYSEFQAVIGTLWPVPDGPTARIAQDIYAELIPLPAERTPDRPTAKPPMWRRFVRRLRKLFTGSGQESPEPASRRVDLNARRSAHALRRALLSERARRPDHPSAWVSFVHYGV